MKEVLFILLCVLLTQNIAKSQEEKQIKYFAFSDCKNDCEIGVISKKHKGKNLNLSIGIHENCCHKYEISASISNDTLQIKYYKYRQPCRCKCNYQLDIIIGKIKKKDFKTISICGSWHKDWDSPEKREQKFKE